MSEEVKKVNYNTGPKNLHLKNSSQLKSEVESIGELFERYNEIKSIDARRMVIEEMIKLYRAEHYSYADNALHLIGSPMLPEAIHDYLRPAIKLNFRGKIVKKFKKILRLR